MSEHRNTFERVRKIIADQLACDPDEVKMDTNIRGDLDLDSLDDVELIMTIEEEFDIAVNDTDAEKLTYVSDLVVYIDNAVAQKALKGKTR